MRVVRKKSIDINDIVIPGRFLLSAPNQEKYNKKKKRYFKTNDYKLIIDENKVLLDGYISYLILKEVGLKYVNVLAYEEEKNQPLTYVYGKHPNSVCDKEYVWRLRNSTAEKIGEIKEGMTLIVNANDKFAPIIVTRVEQLDVPPVNGKIKCVVGVPYEKM